LKPACSRGETTALESEGIGLIAGPRASYKTGGGQVKISA
jgi:hypothetical protein